MEKWEYWRNKDGNISWSLLSWMLLAVFSCYGSPSLNNLLWMALFAGVIFGEKIWSKGIWIARSVGLGLAIVGIMAIFGLIIITPTGISNSPPNRTDGDMHKGTMNMNTYMSKNKDGLPDLKKSIPAVMPNMNNM